MRVRTLLVLGSSASLVACAAILSLPDRTLDTEGGGQNEGGPADASLDRGAETGGGEASGDGGTIDSAVPCEGGLVCGDAGCVDLQSNALHCGACGRDCLGGVCQAGVCGPVKIADNLDTPVGLAVTADGVYVAVNGGNKVLRIDKADGGAAALTLSAAPSSPWGLLIEDAGADARLIVGEDRGGGNARVFLCTLPSCAANAVAAPGDDSIHHFAQLGSELVWTEPNGANGQRLALCNLSNCPGTTADLKTNENNAFGIAVIGNDVYWTIRGATGKVRRCARNNCGNTATDIASNASYANAEGLTTDGTKLYWANNGADTITVCTAPGCTDATTFAAAASPHFVFVDGQRVYWSNGVNSAAGSVQWCPAAGCGDAGARTLATGQVNPLWIAADGTAIYWTNSTATGQVMKARKPL